MSRAYLLAAACVAWGGFVWAQPSPNPPPPAADQTLPSTPAAANAHIAADTLVRIELAAEVNSKTGKRGDKFPIRLASPIVVDGHIAAPAGAAGEGEVVYAEAGKGGGAPGKLVLAARYVEVGGQRIALKAFHLGDSGDDEFTQMRVAAQFIGPAVMFMNGHDVDYPVGTRANAKVAADIDLPAGPAAVAGAAPPPAPPASASSPSNAPTPNAEEPSK